MFSAQSTTVIPARTVGTSVASYCLKSAAVAGVQIGSVLDGFYPGFQGAFNAFFAVGMGRHFAAHLSCRFDNGGQLVIEKLLTRASICIGQYAARRRNFNNVCAVLYRLACGAAAIRGARHKLSRTRRSEAGHL